MQLGMDFGPRPTDDDIMKQTAYAIAATSLVNKAFGVGEPVVGDIEEVASFYMSPQRNDISRVLMALRDYAFDDKLDITVSSDDVYHAFAIAFIVLPISEFFSGQSVAIFERILNAAHARDKLHAFVGDFEPLICNAHGVLDYEQSMLPCGLANGLTVHELALLSGMKEQSVRNALQRDKSIPREQGPYTKQLEIPEKAALDWLKTKAGFSWHSATTGPDEVMVPIARDGSFFSAKCKQGKGYAIGRKGNEKYYETLLEALAALRAMETPYWRRPSPSSGIPGIVKGVRWEPRSHAEIGLK